MNRVIQQSVIVRKHRFETRQVYHHHDKNQINSMMCNVIKKVLIYMNHLFTDNVSQKVNVADLA